MLNFLSTTTTEASAFVGRKKSPASIDLIWLRRARFGAASFIVALIIITDEAQLRRPTKAGAGAGAGAEAEARSLVWRRPAGHHDGWRSPLGAALLLRNASKGRNDANTRAGEWILLVDPPTTPPTAASASNQPHER